MWSCGPLHATFKISAERFSRSTPGRIISWRATAPPPASAGAPGTVGELPGKQADETIFFGNLEGVENVRKLLERRRKSLRRVSWRIVMEQRGYVIKEKLSGNHEVVERVFSMGRIHSGSLYSESERVYCACDKLAALQSNSQLCDGTPNCTAERPTPEALKPRSSRTLNSQPKQGPPYDGINRSILQVWFSGGSPEIMFCRILAFKWSLELLQKLACS